MDLGIQRQHEPERSEEIKQFVDFGYPWSTLSESKRRSNEYNDLRKPGWLPTSIVINILRKGDVRNADARVSDKDLVRVVDDESGVTMALPYKKWTSEWQPEELPPFEVIDGQHRLWAFDKESDPSFQLPVVAFFGLDVSWQAYLFWTINIKPKRINPSLAFDLYPLLRAEDWLDKAEGHAVYRETRSQELTEVLWSNENSPWYDKINMLGERGQFGVTQSAWIKSLFATFVRPWLGRKGMPGGLFGSRIEDGDEVLGWSRAQQAAFLIYFWQLLRTEVLATNADWATAMIAAQYKAKSERPKEAPFYGETSLIMTDQGVRGILHVLNDLCFVGAPSLGFRSWLAKLGTSASDERAVNDALATLPKQKFAPFLKELANGLAKFDWRTSADPSVEDDERREKLIFRGSSGYKELRSILIKHLSGINNEVGKQAKKLR